MQFNINVVHIQLSLSCYASSLASKPDKLKNYIYGGDITKGVTNT
jgi:hypothetical protein